MKLAVFKTLGHWWRIYCVVARLSIMSRFTYPGSVVMSFLNVTMHMVLYVVFAQVIFALVPTIVGFSRDQLFFVIGTALFIDALSWLTFRPGAGHLPDRIRNGKVELAFVRPAHSMFVAIFNRSDPEDIVRIAAGLILVIPHLAAIMDPAGLHIVLYLIALVCSLIINFSLLSTIAALGFFVGKIDGFYSLMTNINEVAHYPYTIFPKSVRWIFFTLFPTAFLGSVPTLILTSGAHWQWLVVSVGWAAVSLWCAVRFWNWAAAHYSGASG